MLFLLIASDILILSAAASRQRSHAFRRRCAYFARFRAPLLPPATRHAFFAWCASPPFILRRQRVAHLFYAAFEFSALI